MTTVRGNSEVKAMRRTLQPLLAATAGLSLFLAACSGESPTSPKPPTDGGPSGGTCTVTIALDATSVTPMAGTAVILRATVRKGGSAVPDGTSVTFTTDFGFFLETGLPSVSKVTQNGFADVTLGSTAAGLAKIKTTFECGSAEKSIEYRAVPANGPFISSITPTSGSCAGGDTVTINGGRFGTTTEGLRVLFGGLPATVRTVSDTQLVVLTPTRTLANPQVPEAVDVVVQFYSGDIPTGSVTAAKAYTYYCVDPNKRLSLTSLAPDSGTPEGGQQVVITGNNFLPSPNSSLATTRVTFGGAAASVLSVSNTSISVLSPRHVLANPAVPEKVDVSVTVDLGLVSSQSGILLQAFTYRSGGGAGSCNGTPGLFIATVQPESPTSAGSPDGGDIVVITGGGFTAGGTSTTVDRAQVFFGANQGVTLSVSDSEVRVTTPRRVLASPDKPETVDVKVVVDAGGPKEACVQANGAYTYYPGGFLEPVITSISPSAGPNDVATRVTMFGRNFKLPMQVFVGGVEAAVVEIKASQIIFLTPIATGPNSALAGQTVPVVVRDPYAGKEYTSPISFRYYSCPSLNSVVPASAPWNQATVVTLAGQNFEEPVEITFTPGTAGATGGTVIRPTITSVSSSLITILMPAVDPGLGGAPNCSNIPGTLTIWFPSLASATCSKIDTTFTYRIDAMTAIAASPTQLNQAGGPFGSPLTGPPATITVTGTNFIDPMTVTIVGGNGASIPVNNAVVANSSQLTFSAPAVLDSYLNAQPCVPTGGTSVTGTRYVPTSFTIRLNNTRTGCSVDLPNVLIYNPADTSCRVPVAVTTATLPTATLCQAYPGATATASGGTTPYTWSASGLPAGMSIDALTGAISGTPRLSANGPGGTTALSVGLSVTDATPTTGSRTVGMQLIDPAGPFTASAAPLTTLTATAVGSSQTTVSVAPGAIGAVTYSATPLSLDGGTVTFAVNPTTGVATLTRSAAPINPGSTTAIVTAADTGCGGTNHQATVTLTLQY
jgi:hypothetical protein